MSNRHFDSTENVELRAKIDKAKQVLPMPSLMPRLGYDEKHIGKTALCPFHDDRHPSFSVFKGHDGFWHYKCFVCDTQGGDEIAFLVKHDGISRREAIKRYLDMAGFPARVSPKSHEYPESRESREYPVSLVYPVSNGQSLDQELEGLAARNACTRADDRSERKRFKLARDIRAVENRLGRELTTAELMLASNEWYRLSRRFLDPRETCEDHFAMFLAELTKVRIPTGEGDTLNKALECVSNLSFSELPTIPGMPGAPERWRRLTALHRELSRLCANGKYFLSYRDAAKAYVGLSQQSAHTITLALARLGVIKIVCKGKARSNGGKAAEFRYLLPEGENGAQEDDGGFEF